MSTETEKKLEAITDRKPQILVVDDDLDTRELLEAFFKPKGYALALYEDAEHALEDLSKQKIFCDVMITDLKLPQLSGIDFIKKLKELEIDVPVILITAHKTVDTAMEAVEAGAYDFVVKPLHFPQLLVSVERALYLNKIKGENSTLKTAVKIKEGNPTPGIIGKSPGFVHALDLAKRVASSNANIFISGESGTGKEVIARTIHNMGSRSNAAFVAINCSSIPENLLESELFGHAKGSFTGAVDKRVGLFEEANGGTLFLDEIGDLPITLQAKLLRVLQERKIKRVGENQFREVDVRVISATHRDLKKEVAEKRFRDDLFFRLNVIQIKLPPLRERKEDILPLAEFFLKKFVALNNSSVKAFSKAAMEKLFSHPWPGNVRELENAIERAVVLCNTDLIAVEDLPEEDRLQEFLGDAGTKMEEFENLDQDKILTADEVVKRYIRYVLKRNNGAKEKTARDLNIDRKTLYRKIQEMQLAN